MYSMLPVDEAMALALEKACELHLSKFAKKGELVAKQIDQICVSDALAQDVLRTTICPLSRLSHGWLCNQHSRSTLSIALFRR